MAKEVRHCVARRMRELSTYTRTTTVEDTMSEELEQPAPRWRKKIFQVCTRPEQPLW